MSITKMHRTASWNEVSGRYSVLPEKFYIPVADQVCHQDNKNRQGRAEPLEQGFADMIMREQREQCEAAFEMYHKHLKLGLARETARDILPFCTYTEKVWSISLHNMFHLLGLRLDAHAQYEIRVFAEVLGSIVKKLWPISYAAFEDYRLKAITLSRMDIAVISMIAEFYGSLRGRSELFTAVANDAVHEWASLDRCRERDECFSKLAQMGIVTAKE